uniref:DUF38 domain-containing protein n=1 Tax=Panagrolaimus davidi TaxID=227884 RepID=A0A914Q2M7_9BILA
MFGYYLPSNSLLYKVISTIVARFVECLSLRTSHSRCLSILNGIQHDLTKLQITREVLENGDCFEALSKISAQKLSVDAGKMGNDLLKNLPIKTRELEINDLAFVQLGDGKIENPLLLSIEKLCIREYNVHQNAEFDLPKLIAGYRKCFPKTKSFDLIFYTTADRESNIIRHFYTKCIKNIRKQNPGINLRIYIDVEFVKDDPMPVSVF